MASKTIVSRPATCLNQQRNINLLGSQAYGKPSKPRCYEPSMFEILSWKDGEQEERQYQTGQTRQHERIQVQQPASTKKIMHCKSLPAEQFVRSRQPNNIFIQPNFEENYADASNQHINIQKANQHTNYSSNQERKSQSLKKTSNPTKYIEYSKQTSMEDTQVQAPNLDKFMKENRKSLQQQKEQTKMKKLRKKTVPAYVDPQRKPRYLQTKKSAVQKMIDSASFDKEKFEKMKEEQIKRFKQTSRDLSNTAFLTYFNKPPFQNYGRQNKHSSGVLYGDYMYSHNVYPHTGDNHPKKQQTYITALTRAKSAGNIRPHPPMTRHMEEKMISSYLTLSQIYPKDAQFQSIPIKNQTVLEKLPMFNYVRSSNEGYKKLSPYLKADEIEDSQGVQNQYLREQQTPKYYSNKREFEGKQITYSKKLSLGENYF